MKPELPNAWPGLAVTAPNSPAAKEALAVRIYEKPHTRNANYDEDGMKYYHIAVCGNEHEIVGFLTDDMKATLELANAHSALLTRVSELEAGLKDLCRAYVGLLESGRDRITERGGQCDPVEVMERADPLLAKARALLEPRPTAPEITTKSCRTCKERPGLVRVDGNPMLGSWDICPDCNTCHECRGTGKRAALLEPRS